MRINFIFQISNFKIGWRPFGIDSVKRSKITMRILNIVYPLFVFILLLFNYVYEIIVCQGKLDVAKETSVKLSLFLFIS